jgi:LysM repeat protein
MIPVRLHLLPIFLLAGMITLRSSAQTAPVVKPRIEPGLENAVEWQWTVLPSDEKAWGIQLNAPEPPPQEIKPGVPSISPTISIKPMEVRPTEYVVKSGDALGIISRKYGMTVLQLKTFNGLTKDTIRIGQTLKIPTLEEIKAMLPPPPEPKPEIAEKEVPKAAPKAKPLPVLTREVENVLFQVFLDREKFPTGPIDGNPGVTFEKALQLYRLVHDDVPGLDQLQKKALASFGEAFARYKLKAEDFRFIAPPLEEVTTAKKPVRKSKTRQPMPEPPPLSYEALIAQPFLAYRTPWEFIAERFHCDETFLRKQNAKITGVPTEGTEFLVPNVIPFEIENAFVAPLQPTADPAKPVTAAIVDLSRLEVFEAGKLVAAMPLSSARPDLRGRGTWTILEALPRPRLMTKQELKTKPVVGTLTTPIAEPAPVAPAAEQFLAPGPNNPLGFLWIHLAKSKSTTPLPYGLHGTSIPGRMKSQESLGGFRLANWDIVRAVRLLPPGTPLQWR